MHYVQNLQILQNALPTEFINFIECVTEFTDFTERTTSTKFKDSTECTADYLKIVPLKNLGLKNVHGFTLVMDIFM